MSRLKPLLMSLAAATALTVVPLSFDALQVPVGVAPVEAASTVSIDIFFKPLASYGVWVKHTKYRYVFCPKVDAKWRPYSHGHWIFLKNYGWFFASDEPFAWAVYHYGRWFRDPRIGWCWVPGNAWAGAWVAWRRSNDFIGWAALPPSREGFSVDVDIFNQEPPQEDWVFVQPKRFLEPQLNVAVVFGDQQPDVFQKTEFVGPVVIQNNIVVNNIITLNFIQQQTGQQVKEVEPKIVTEPGQATVTGTTVALFAPQIAPPKQTEAPAQAVDEAQAAQQIGNGGQQSSSASSEQPSSAASSNATSSEASSSAASSAASSSAASSQASSSQASSSEAASSKPASSSSEAAPASSSSQQMAPASSSEQKAAPASSSEPKAAPAASSSEPKAAPASSSEEKPTAPASSSEEKAAPASSSKQEAAPASSKQEAAPSSAECPKGYEIVKGQCVPIKGQSQGNGDQSSAAQ